MSRRGERDYIYLIWKDPKTRRNFTIGELSKNGKYEFSYGHEIEEAIKFGFELLLPFTDLEKSYVNERVFPTFSSRLPDPKRRGIENILEKYGLVEFDDFELLRKSGARLPIDNLEFIDPILSITSDQTKDFYVAGTRHCLNCQGADCERIDFLKVGDAVKLKHEPENRFDVNAVAVYSGNGQKIGFMPRYYCKPFLEMMRSGFVCSCTIIEINKKTECSECIKVEMQLRKPIISNEKKA